MSQEIQDIKATIESIDTRLAIIQEILEEFVKQKPAAVVNAPTMPLCNLSPLFDNV